MTDAPRDKQIREAANTYASYFEDKHKNDIRQAFNAGATEVHHISYEAGKKDGINEAVDAVLYKLENLKATFKTYYDYVEFKEELEALKTEKV